MPESLPDAWRRAAERNARRSFSVHCLCLISSDFMLFSPAGRDDADNLFATDTLPIGVNNQHHSSFWLDANFPKGVPPLFSRFVDAVRADEAMFVFEDQGRCLEGDAAMLALVSPIFGFVPFVAHNVYMNSNTSDSLYARAVPSRETVSSQKRAANADLPPRSPVLPSHGGVLIGRQAYPVDTQAAALLLFFAAHPGVLMHAGPLPIPRVSRQGAATVPGISPASAIIHQKLWQKLVED